MGGLELVERPESEVGGGRYMVRDKKLVNGSA